MTDEERQRIAREYGVTVPEGTKVKKLPASTYSIPPTYSRRDAVERSKRVTRRHWKFQAAARKRAKNRGNTDES